jgi:hypothetical protein
VYADIAMTVGEYLRGRHQCQDADSLVAITDMTIKKALIAKPSGTHLLRAATTVDWDAGSALCRFLSLNVSPIQIGHKNGHAYSGIV